MRVENSKGECNLGQHEINFRYADALRTADDHAIYKNGAKEIAAAGGHGDQLHGQVQRARGQLVPHPLLARRRRRPAVSRATGDVRVLPRRPARLPARADAAAGAERQLLQALRRGLVRADRGRLGPRQPHLLAARRRPRRRAALREPRRRRRPQPLPGAAARSSPPGCTASSRGSSSSPRSRATPTWPPTSRACPRRCARRASCSPAARSRARRSATRSSRTTSTPPTSSWRRSSRRSPTGSASGDSSGCEPMRAGVRSRRVVSLDAVFAPVRSQTAFEETVERLGTAIKLGLLPPGTRLPAERELCAKLGIARSTLRQALIALGQSGHLHAIRGRGGGTFVADPQPPAEPPSAELLGGWREVCDERLAVELGVAVLAAERAEPATLDALDELVDRARRRARGLRRLPPGRRAPARRPRRGDRQPAAGPRR